MRTPYKGKFKVTQQFKGSAHDGLDLVGIESKNIYSTVDGVVEYAGWESALNHKKGFGKYVRIKQNNSVDRYYFGHLSEIKVKKGQKVTVGM
ncbi:MAG: M23 family metallopeptidase, partial [Clostridia bacterium]|nr:M23 family metallopeptidase [Clostridia bacterium]